MQSQRQSPQSNTCYPARTKKMLTSSATVILPNLTHTYAQLSLYKWRSLKCQWSQKGGVILKKTKKNIIPLPDPSSPSKYRSLFWRQKHHVSCYMWGMWLHPPLVLWKHPLVMSKGAETESSGTPGHGVTCLVTCCNLLWGYHWVWSHSLRSHLSMFRSHLDMESHSWVTLRPSVTVLDDTWLLWTQGAGLCPLPTRLTDPMSYRTYQQLCSPALHKSLGG